MSKRYPVWIAAALCLVLAAALCTVWCTPKPTPTSEQLRIPVQLLAITAAPEPEPPPEPDTPMAQSVLRAEESALLPPLAYRKPIDAFLRRCMQSQITLYAEDLSDLFVEPNENALLNQAVLDLTVGMRRLQPNDLTLRFGQFGVTYNACETLKNGDVVVFLYEDHELQFACLDGRTSYSAGIEHYFTLRETESGWKIVEHRRVEDGFLLLTSLLEDRPHDPADIEHTKILLSDILSDLFAIAAEQVGQRAASFEPVRSNETSPTADRPYDREAAIAYARSWTDTHTLKRNPDWAEFDNLGGNCMNYASQCLYAGGIPMDIRGGGSAQWKYYGSGIHNANAAYGRSASWTGVDAFYNYASQNRGTGLVATVDAPLAAAQPGDVMLISHNDNPRHAVVVSEVIYDDAGRPVDLLLLSNTTDHIDFPASAYVYQYWRLIHILGSR